MKTTTIFKEKQALLVFNQTASDYTDPYLPFALTDLFIHEAARQQQGLMHFWEAEQTVILGMQDTRVTDLTNGLEVFLRHGYQFLARNSGGLAVVADAGILNFSLFIPLAESQSLSIIEAYEVMTEIIQQAFKVYPVKIVAKEVPDSYCPGDFDLSINDQKFAGIAQRRVGNGIAVMIYLSVNGDQHRRGEMVKEFYQASLGAAFGTGKFPPVRPDSMANLSELLATDLTVADVKKLILAVFTTHLGRSLVETKVASFIKDNNLASDLTKHLKKMEQRNDIIPKNGGQSHESTL